MGLAAVRSDLLGVGSSGARRGKRQYCSLRKGFDESSEWYHINDVLVEERINVCHLGKLLMRYLES